MASRKLLLPLVLITLTYGVALLLRGGTPLPDIDATLEFQRIDGTKQLFADFRGKPLLVTFWSPTCAVCLYEVKDLNKLYADNQGGEAFNLLGISMVYDRPDHVLETSSKAGMQYPVYLDLDNSVGQAFGQIRYTPTTFLIDAEGEIVLKLSGKMDFDMIKQSLNELMV